MQVIISNRRAGKFTSTEKEASRDAIAAVADSLSKDKVVSDQKPHYDTGRRKVIYEATEGQMKALQNDAPEDVIVEPVIEYQQKFPLTFKVAGVAVTSVTGHAPVVL